MPIGRGVLAGKPRHAAGRRDLLVEIEQLAEPVGGAFPTEGPTSLAFVWMSRLDVRADERFAAGQESAYVETQWHMPYRDDMDPDLVDVPARRRLKHRTRIYNIRAASVIGRRDGIELLTLAQTGA